MSALAQRRIAVYLGNHYSLSPQPALSPLPSPLPRVSRGDVARERDATIVPSEQRLCRNTGDTNSEHVCAIIPSIAYLALALDVGMSPGLGIYSPYAKLESSIECVNTCVSG